LVNLGYITYGIRVEGYNTWTSKQGQISLVHFISVKRKTNKNVYCYKHKKNWFVVIMATQNEEEIRLEENPDQGPPKEPRQNNEGSSTTQVLETMRNLIMELQVFKADNEKLKKAQEDQQEINEMLLQHSNKEDPKRQQQGGRSQQKIL
jgi:hypothetical protein